MRKLHFNDSTFTLAQHNRVSKLELVLVFFHMRFIPPGHNSGTGADGIEKVCMDMERIDGIEFGYVNQIDSHKFVFLNFNCPISGVIESSRVDTVNFIISVEVSIKTVHHHHVFLDSALRIFTSRGARAPSGIGINYENPIESLVNVTLKWTRMTMVEMKTVRFSLKAIPELLPRETNCSGIAPSNS